MESTTELSRFSPRARQFALLAAAALLLVAFAPTLQFLFERWTSSIWQNGHGVFIPLIVGYLAWDHFSRRPLTEPASSAWGFLFLVPGLACLVLDSAIRTQLLGAAGLVLCLPGLSLLLLGMERTKALGFPLALSAFMLPIPAVMISSLHLFLRRISAWFSTNIVDLIGIPVTREDTTLLIPRGFIEVSDACSGFSTLYAAITLSFILAYMTPSWTRRIGLLVGAWVIAIVCNAIRVTILVLMGHYGGFHLLDTWLHEGSGFVTFVLVIVVLFSLADRRGIRGELP